MALEIADRRCRIKTSLGQETLKLKRMRAYERLSSLSEMTLDLVSTNESIKASDIVGKDLSLEMPLKGGDTRYFHGVVSRFTQLGSYGDEDRAFISYQAVVVPWLWTLTRNRDCRVFENKSVTAIAEEIFGAWGFGDFELYKLSTNCESDKMDYCVQYRESDFAFLSRLFEQWGLGYTFRHDEKKCVLVLFDDSPSLPDNEVDASVTFTGQSGTGERGDVDEWIDRQEFLPGAFMLKDYNFEDPPNKLEMPKTSAVELGQNARFEFFDYPGEFVTEQSGHTSPRGESFVGFRMEAEEADSRRIEGRSSCTGFRAGSHFTMDGHFNSAYNKRKFLLTEVQHVIQQAVGTEKDPTIYENFFACLPADVRFRPKQVTEKPVVVGTHTAAVVGRNGKPDDDEEIHCDPYGRVRIKFHWNRHVSDDRKDLCWARVQQSMAGTGWGTQFLPRVGHEVIVTFLEGDPDRPLVTGAVYNKTHMPPYSLPANKTQSGWKTRSSEGGNDANYNEIRFEDKKGSEALSIHAEKDMGTSVENDSSLSVGNNRNVTVKKDQTILVEEGNEEYTVKAGTRTTKINKTDTLTLEADQVTTVAGGEKGSVLIVSTKDRSVSVADGNYKANASKKLILGAPTIEATGNDLVAVSSPKKVEITSTKEVVLKVGESSIKLSAQGIELSAPKISSSAVGAHEIKGAMVKIN